LSARKGLLKVEAPAGKAASKASRRSAFAAREEKGDMPHMADLRKRARLALAGLAALLSSLSPALAKDVALTQDSVSRFLASYAHMRAVAVTDGLKAGTDAEAQKNPIGAVIKAVKSSKLQTEARTIAARHGFADLKDWLETGKAIGQAYVFVTSGPARGVARDTVDKNKDRAIKELEKLGLVTDKQKEKLKEHLDNLGEQLSREPPQQNVAVVRGMKPDIEAAVKIGVN
jgi:hypothetical protein